MGVASLQLPVRYPNLPALLIGQFETLMWRINTVNSNLGGVPKHTSLSFKECYEPVMKVINCPPDSDTTPPKKNHLFIFFSQ